MLHETSSSGKVDPRMNGSLRLGLGRELSDVEVSEVSTNIADAQSQIIVFVFGLLSTSLRNKYEIQLEIHPAGSALQLTVILNRRTVQTHPANP